MGIVTRPAQASTQAVPLVPDRRDATLGKFRFRHAPRIFIRHGRDGEKAGFFQRAHPLRKIGQDAERKTEHRAHAGAQYLRAVQVAAVLRQERPADPEGLRRAQNGAQVCWVLDVFQRHIAAGGLHLPRRFPVLRHPDNAEDPLRPLRRGQKIRDVRRDPADAARPGQNPFQIALVPARGFLRKKGGLDRGAAHGGIRAQARPLRQKLPLLPPEGGGAGELCRAPDPFVFSAGNHIWQHHKGYSTK